MGARAEQAWTTSRWCADARTRRRPACQGPNDVGVGGGMGVEQGPRQPRLRQLHRALRHDVRLVFASRREDEVIFVVCRAGRQGVGA